MVFMLIYTNSTQKFEICEFYADLTNLIAVAQYTVFFSHTKDSGLAVQSVKQMGLSVLIDGHCKFNVLQ